MPETTWWLYIIETNKKQLYTGITTDVERRFEEHSAVWNKEAGAKGAKFFRSQKPVKVVFQQGFSTRSEASKKEAEVKKLSSHQKRQLFS